MIQSIRKQRRSIFYRFFSGVIVFTFMFSSVLPPQTASAQAFNPAMVNLPAVGTMVTTTPAFMPTLIKGVQVNPENPLELNFIVNTGETNLKDEAFRAEADKLIKYFMASLTVPEDELWVNLSPYESERIIPDAFGVTEMGRDMLAQDYILKQLTASLIYPEKQLGRKFWDRVHKRAARELGVTDIPVNTFNKVWIVPDKAVVYENGGVAYVVQSHLKVMLEADYVALQRATMDDGRWTKDESSIGTPDVTSEIIREIIVPEIEKEVNQGETFAQLRQIYHSMILATWYKNTLRESLLGQVYVDQNKVLGIDLKDKSAKQKIYDQYLQAFKVGVYDFIKEDYDPVTKDIIPRKYFSGGFTTKSEKGDLATLVKQTRITPQSAYRDLAMAARTVEGESPNNRLVTMQAVEASGQDVVESLKALAAQLKPEQPAVSDSAMVTAATSNREEINRILRDLQELGYSEGVRRHVDAYLTGQGELSGISEGVQQSGSLSPQAAQWLLDGAFLSAAHSLNKTDLEFLAGNLADINGRKEGQHLQQVPGGSVRSSQKFQQVWNDAQRLWDRWVLNGEIETAQARLSAASLPSTEYADALNELISLQKRQAIASLKLSPLPSKGQGVFPAPFVSIGRKIYEEQIISLALNIAHAHGFEAEEAKNILKQFLSEGGSLSEIEDQLRSLPNNSYINYRTALISLWFYVRSASMTPGPHMLDRARLVYESIFGALIDYENVLALGGSVRSNDARRVLEQQLGVGWEDAVSILQRVYAYYNGFYYPQGITVWAAGQEPIVAKRFEVLKASNSRFMANSNIGELDNYLRGRGDPDGRYANSQWLLDSVWLFVKYNLDPKILEDFVGWGELQRIEELGLRTADGVLIGHALKQDISNDAQLLWERWKLTKQREYTRDLLRKAPGDDQASREERQRLWDQISAINTKIFLLSQHLAQPSAATDAAMAATPREILLVDDQDSLLTAFGHTLEDEGYSVTKANNGREALEYISKNPNKYTGILTDLHMPEVNGLELIRALTTVKPELPVVLVTSDDLQDEQIIKTKIENSNLQRVVSKPVGRTELVQLVEGVFGPAFDDAAMLSETERNRLPQAVLRNLESQVISAPEHIEALKLLIEIGEADLLAQWDEPGVRDEGKRSFLNQIAKLDNSTSSLVQYKRRAIAKLKIAKAGANPLEGYTPEVPNADNLTEINERFDRLVQRGIKQVNKSVFALVAGGLGTRLGYKGDIKVKIPLDVLTMESYMEKFIKNILALQERSNQVNGEDETIPLVIMTSDETHDKTVAFLAENDFFDMQGLSVLDAATEEVIVDTKGKVTIINRESGRTIAGLKQIVLFKQESVPAMKGYEGKFFLKPGDPYSLEVQPHNHGDVHLLMKQTGIAKAFRGQGKSHTIFFQDTNGQVFNAIPAALGNSLERDFKFNFIAVNRRPGEKSGGIAKMVHEDGTGKTFNIEYNLLDPVLRATISPDGDVADPETGFSRFPGNLNVFIIDQELYDRKLDETGGLLGEIVNPKEGTLISRLEAPMQDIARELDGDVVGVTVFEPRFVFAAVKNSLEKARAATQIGNYPESMAPGEFISYKYRRLFLRMAGVDIDFQGHTAFSQGVPFSNGAKVVWSPSWAITHEDVAKKFQGGSVSSNSVVVIDGEDIFLKNVHINGALIVKTAPGVSLEIENLEVNNDGWAFDNLTESEMQDPLTPEYLKIRGYKLRKNDQMVFDLTDQQPGVYRVGADGEVVRVADHAMAATEALFSTDDLQRLQQLINGRLVSKHIDKIVSLQVVQEAYSRAHGQLNVLAANLAGQKTTGLTQAEVASLINIVTGSLKAAPVGDQAMTVSRDSAKQQVLAPEKRAEFNQLVPSRQTMEPEQFEQALFKFFHGLDAALQHRNVEEMLGVEQIVRFLLQRMNRREARQIVEPLEFGHIIAMQDVLNDPSREFPYYEPVEVAGDYAEGDSAMTTAMRELVDPIGGYITNTHVVYAEDFTRTGREGEINDYDMIHTLIRNLEFQEQNDMEQGLLPAPTVRSLESQIYAMEVFEVLVEGDRINQEAFNLVIANPVNAGILRRLQMRSAKEMAIDQGGFVPVNTKEPADRLVNAFKRKGLISKDFATSSSAQQSIVKKLQEKGGFKRLIAEEGVRGPLQGFSVSRKLSSFEKEPLVVLKDSRVISARTTRLNFRHSHKLYEITTDGGPVLILDYGDNWEDDTTPPAGAGDQAVTAAASKTYSRVGAVYPMEMDEILETLEKAGTASAKISAIQRLSRFPKQERIAAVLTNMLLSNSDSRVREVIRDYLGMSDAAMLSGKDLEIAKLERGIESALAGAKTEGEVTGAVMKFRDEARRLGVSGLDDMATKRRLEIMAKGGDWAMLTNRDIQGVMNQHTFKASISKFFSGEKEREDFIIYYYREKGNVAGSQRFSTLDDLNKVLSLVSTNFSGFYQDRTKGPSSSSYIITSGGNYTFSVRPSSFRQANRESAYGQIEAVVNKAFIDRSPKIVYFYDISEEDLNLWLTEGKRLGLYVDASRLEDGTSVVWLTTHISEGNQDDQFTLIDQLFQEGLEGRSEAYIQERDDSFHVVFPKGVEALDLAMALEPQVGIKGTKSEQYRYTTFDSLSHHELFYDPDERPSGFKDIHHDRAYSSIPFDGREPKDIGVTTYKIYVGKTPPRPLVRTLKIPGNIIPEIKKTTVGIPGASSAVKVSKGDLAMAGDLSEQVEAELKSGTKISEIVTRFNLQQFLQDDRAGFLFNALSAHVLIFDSKGELFSTRAIQQIAMRGDRKLIYTDNNENPTVVVLADHAMARQKSEIFGEVSPDLQGKSGGRQHAVSGDAAMVAEEKVSSLQTAEGRLRTHTKGGIDLNPALLDLQIKRDGKGVPLPLNMQPIHNMKIEGFVPIIINVTPITNLPLLLGMDTDRWPADTDYSYQDQGASAIEPEKISLKTKNRSDYVIRLSVAMSV